MKPTHIARQIAYVINHIILNSIMHTGFKSGIIKTDHCVKNVRIQSYFGPHFPVFGLSNSKYGHFLHSGHV